MEKILDIVAGHSGLYGFCLLLAKKDKLGQFTVINTEVKRKCLQKDPDILSATLLPGSTLDT
jgi:hypothetical protein